MQSLQEIRNPQFSWSQPNENTGYLQMAWHIYSDTLIISKVFRVSPQISMHCGWKKCLWCRGLQFPSTEDPTAIPWSRQLFLNILAAWSSRKPHKAGPTSSVLPSIAVTHFFKPPRNSFSFPVSFFLFVTRAIHQTASQWHNTCTVSSWSALLPLVCCWDWASWYPMSYLLVTPWYDCSPLQRGPASLWANCWQK